MENSILNKGDYSSSHQEAKFVLKRKPDFETETLRMWVPSDREKKQYKNVDNRVKYRGYIFGLVGFTVVKKKRKVVFAYKFKDENRVVMAYLDDKKRELQDIYNDLKKYAEFIGYEFRDVREVWDKILLEEHRIKRLAKKADLKDKQVKGGD